MKRCDARLHFTVKAATWTVNSHHLFDFESTNLYTRAFLCHGTAHKYSVIRTGNLVELVPCGVRSPCSSLAPQCTVDQLPDSLWAAAWNERESPEELLQISFVDSDTPELILQAPGTSPSYESNSSSDCGEGLESENRSTAKLRGPHSSSEAGATAQENALQSPIGTSGARRPSARVDGSRSLQPPADSAQSSGQLWIVVKSLKGRGMQLKEGGSLRLGRYAFKLRHVVLDVEAQKSFEINARSKLKGVPSSPRGEGESRAALSESEAQERLNRVCRICLCEEENPETDPLVAPCKCCGSMRWVHIICLRKWMAGRLHQRPGGTIEYFYWRELGCELCQEPYPSHVTVSCEAGKRPDPPVSGRTTAPQVEALSDGGELNESGSVHSRGKAAPLACQQGSTAHSEKAQTENAHSGLTKAHNANTLKTHMAQSETGETNRIELFEIPQPKIPFVVLESCLPSEAGEGLHFVSFVARTKHRLGRGHAAEIRLHDISVSRVHATLQLKSGRSSMCDSLCGEWYRRRQQNNGVTNEADGVARPALWIFDCNSKFGTVVSSMEPTFRVRSNQKVSIQAGRTVLTINLSTKMQSFCFSLRRCKVLSEDVHLLEDVQPNVAVQPQPASPRGEGLGETNEFQTGQDYL